MPAIMQAASVAVLLLLGETGGHMIMNTPKPYNLDIQPFLQVDPMSGDHYPFPCHNQYSFATRTPVEAGHATLVNFTGGAQHGGGSCQFSITYDEPVGGGGWNKSAKFKTIYSIIGGCPAVFTDETHNLAPAAKDPSMREDGKHCGNDSGIDCIRSFMISIPKFLRNGPATFAWTWFNKLGNKEMYMNCAPINITGGTGDEKQIEDLPDIFVANYPNDPELPTCITGTHNDKVVVNFPNPGKYGLILQGPVEPVNKPSGYCTQIPKPSALPAFESGPGDTVPGSGGSDGNNPATSEETPTTSSSSTTASMIMRTTNIPLPDDGSSSTSTPRLTSSRTPPPKPTLTTPTTTISESTSISLAPPPPAPMGPRPAAANKPDDDKAVACPAHGELVCLGQGLFGLCNWGWAVPQRVAAGTECKEGHIVKRDRDGSGWDWEDGKLAWEDENGVV